MHSDSLRIIPSKCYDQDKGFMFPDVHDRSTIAHGFIISIKRTLNTQNYSCYVWGFFFLFQFEFYFFLNQSENEIKKKTTTATSVLIYSFVVGYLTVSVNYFMHI